jgi:DNA-binding transcriptional regulator LsrR (DeoR family)
MAARLQDYAQPGSLTVAQIDELRLMTRVARLYHEQGLRQSEIAEQLDLSQSSISRLLRHAEQEGIVKITVAVPTGTYPDLEKAFEEKYGLKEVIVADCAEDEERQIMRELGRATAFYLENTLNPHEIIGMSASGSTTMMAMLDAFSPRRVPDGIQVVQIIGDIGDPAASAAGTHLVRRMAELLGAGATLLPAPAIPHTEDVYRAFLDDQFVRAAMDMFEQVTLALMSVGPVTSAIARLVGDTVPPEEVDMLLRLGAVGDVCLRFFDISGAPVLTPIDDRVIGMTLEGLRRVKRVVAVAGGHRKLAAIRGALEGGWMNVLITDRFTAERLAVR